MRPAAEDGVRAAPAAVVAHRTARIWRSQIYDPPEEGQIPPRASVGLADFARQRFRMDTVTNQQVIDWVVDMAAASGAPEDRRGWETEAVGYQGQVEVIIGDRCYSGPSDGSRWVAGECPWWERPDWLLRTLGSFVLTADIGAKDEVRGQVAHGYDGKLDPVLLGQVAHDLPLKTLFGRRLRDEMLARAWIDDHGRAVRIQLRSTARPRFGDANASWDTLELWDFGADLDIATPTGI